MSQLTVNINGRPYVMGCEDGQEPHLRELAALFDRQVRQVSAEVGQLGETRLFLMGALLLADELSDMKLRLAHSQRELTALQNSHARIEQRAAQALEKAAAKVESLAG